MTTAPVLREPRELEELKNRHEVLGLYVSRGKFRKNGNEYEAFCPFHQDKASPSCKLNRKQGRWLWHCFGACQRGGSIIDFVMASDHLDEGGAIQRIKHEIGWSDGTCTSEIPVESPPSEEHTGSYKTYSLSDHAYFERKLAENQMVKDWLLRERGITFVTAQRLHLGYRQTIKSNAEDIQDILNKGWITFPSFANDRVTLVKYRSIVRRAFSRQAGMETCLFNTGTIDAVSDLYITAGDFDAVVLEQAGFRAVSLTSDSMPITKAMIDTLLAASKIILAGDSDASGKKAMAKLGAALEERSEGRASMLRWPDGVKDANDLWMKHKGDVESFRRSVLELSTKAVAPNGPVEVISSPKSEPPTSPSAELTVADMPEAALDGRLGELCRTRLRDFPRAYSFPALVTCASALVPIHGETEHFTHDDVRPSSAIRTNLYACLVGGPGSGKSSAIEQSLVCLGMRPKHECLVEGKFGSAEGMLAHLEGTSGANRLLFPDELGHLLEKANIENSSFTYVLNTGYYSDNFLVGMAKNKKVEFQCRLSLAGGVVSETFGDSFGAKTTGGLHDRFIFGLEPKPSGYLWKPYDTEPERMDTPVAVEADPDVWDLRNDWVRNNVGVTPRIAEHALRVAAVCASFDGRKVLRARDLGPALEFAKYQARVRMVLEPNPGENPDARCAHAVLSWLRSNASDGRNVERRSVYRATHSSRFGPGVYDRTLKNLSFNEDIRQRRIENKATIALTGANVVLSGATEIRL